MRKIIKWLCQHIHFHKNKCMENYMEYNDICPHLNENWVRFCNLTPKEQEHEYERIRTGHEVCLKGSERRLVYYRLHGLDNCPDYPGGDEAFVRDVLSGGQREERNFSFDMKKEDAYIFECMEKERFIPDMDFLSGFILHPKVKVTAQLILMGQGLMFTAPPRYFEDPFKPDSYLYNDSVGYFDN